MSIVIYLFYGIVWNVILDLIATASESENRLNNWERVFSILAWPLTLIIFIYHFIKTMSQR